MQKIAVTFDSYLEMGHPWSDQHPLDCFKSVIFSSRLVCSHFFEASSWNGVSLYQGYSPVTV